jgi:proteasome lid subunit RPN8/RPN11/ubiquitin-protein ligase
VNLARLRGDSDTLREYAATSGGRVVVLGFEQDPWVAMLKLKIPCPADSSFPRRRHEEVTLRIAPRHDYPDSAPDFIISPVPFVCNVYVDGRVCMGSPGWTRTTALTTFVERIEKMLILDPETSHPGSPANSAAAEWYRGVVASRAFTIPTMKLVKAAKPRMFQWLDDEEKITLPTWDSWLNTLDEVKRSEVLAVLISNMHYLEIDEQARKTALDHVSAFHVEQAGLLIGYAYEHAESNGAKETRRYIVRVTDAIPAKDNEATPVSVKIPPATWSEAQPFLNAGKLVVGWYHSHPNLGAFFSGTDRRTQAALFNHGYSIGWVIDWVRKEEGFFVGSDSKSLKK